MKVLDRSSFSYLLLFLFILFGRGTSDAQSHGNEWIEYGQQYYKIPITESGVHRITYNTIQQVPGIPSSIDPRNFQLFGREKERYIHVEGEDDGSFDPGDYIEFYAEKNDGWLDSLLYKDVHLPGHPTDPSAMTDPHYSLYNDTVHYYLTWNNSTNNQRMAVSTDSAYNSYPAVDFVWRTALRSLKDRYGEGLRSFFDSYPQFTEGEGWVGSLFNKGQSDVQDLPTPDPYQGAGAPDAELTAVSVSESDASTNAQGYNHHLQLLYGTGSGTVLADTSYEGYQMNRFDRIIPNGDIGSPNTRIRHRSVDDLGVATDYHSVSYIELSYPFAMDLDGRGEFHFEVPVAGNPQQHVPFSNFGGSGAIAYTLDGQPERLPVVHNGPDADLVVPQQGAVPTECFITASDSIHQVQSLEPVSGDGFFRDFSQLDPDSAFLILTHSSLMSDAQDYADYRRDQGQDVVTVDVQELYHQFGGGIPKHALAIRRFAAFTLDEWSSSPAALFLLGKSVREAGIGGPGSRKSPSAYSSNLIPTYGYPSSDLLFTSGLEGSDPVMPAFPVGRLSAKNGDDVQDYLQKVQEYESKKEPLSQRKAWMKRVLHFGGGGTSNEQQQFAQYLANYENTVEAPHFGGDVHTFLKSSSSPIQLNVKDSLKSLIDAGTVMMTFFGHGSGSGFDQSIDEPQNYNNQGKYPLLLANSCYSGDIHQADQVSTSEKFVMAEQKGMIGFIASVKQGVAQYLNGYSSSFYQALSHAEYGSTVGEQMLWTIDDYYDGNSTSFSRVMTSLSMTLHGDPMLSLYSSERPEYRIRPSDMSFEPSDVTPELDSFDVDLSITNIGRATSDSFSVDLTRRFPGQGNESTLNRSLSHLYFRDTVDFRFPVGGIQANGVNAFDARVDRPSFVDELFDEFSNNIVEGRELLIRTGDVFPADPFEYAIIPDDSVTLQASTGDPFAAPQDIHFQIDTNDSYNSPMLQSTDVHHAGGVVEWKPPIRLSDSTVYYWRVSPDSNRTDDGSPSWRESSFQYIPDQWGWGQSHFFQFEDNGYQNLLHDRPDREFEFFTGTRTVDCNVYGNASNSSEYSGTSWSYDLELQEANGCGTAPALHVAVIDPDGSEVWATYGEDPSTGNMVNADKQFGNQNNGTNCRSRSERYFIYRQGNATQMQALEDMLTNEVPDGHYVLIYTWRYVSYGDWNQNNPNLASFLQGWGSDSIGVGKDSVPFIFFTQKGSPDSTQEVYGNFQNEQISLSADMHIQANEGIMLSEWAGPALEWDALYWRGRPQEQNSSDETRIRLLGRELNGDVDTLGTFSGGLDSVPDLETYADASQYPYLRLMAELSDTADLTPEQMERWQLLHQPAPEAAVDPSQGYSFHSDTVQEGEKVEMGIPIRNISAFDMDSLLVGHWFQDDDGLRKPQAYRRIAPLSAGSTIVDTAAFSTRGFTGKNAFLTEINPLDTNLGRYDQLEQYHFNNFARRNFRSSKDQTNPILDVTFDGRHIMDGDIVSAEPEIHISLDDENEFLLMDEAEDTSNFELFLTDPDGQQERIYFENSSRDYDLTWTPASSKENEFRIEYLPDFQKSGEYELLVQGQDKSGNASGDLRYKIGFEVIQEMGVSNVLNYPNPFSTRTQFVFTLTGSRVPDQFHIRIMTVSGKVVKEISKKELGPLRIGRNRTSYWWDGTDEFGDPLANGIYLYQVIVKDPKDDVEHRETAADEYFDKGFGKMYLMR